MTLIAFHGEQAVKDKYVARVRAHRQADELIKGYTGQGGKGCAAVIKQADKLIALIGTYGVESHA